MHSLHHPEKQLLHHVYIRLLQQKPGRGTQKQKALQRAVAVARALSCKPDIILADEPTGNLDRRTGDELMQTLLLSQRYFEQTILMVTHDLELAQTADRIIKLEDGKVHSDLRGGQR